MYDVYKLNPFKFMHVGHDICLICGFKQIDPYSLCIPSVC